jgi:SAM-dependent methyltransferase
MTGWEPDKRSHFDDIVLNYDKIRPEYPDKLFEDIINFTGAGKKKALEIGAGTGKATAPFIDAGFDITAVEISENMAEFLREKFKDYKDFNVIVDAFEDAVLEENHYDLVYVANAFHWIDAEIGCPKVFRLLRSGGVFALFRYNGVQAVFEDYYKEIQSVYEKYYRSYYKTSGPPPIDVYGKPEQILHRFGFSDLKDYGFDDITMKLYDGSITYSADEYIELLDTFSDHRHLPEENKVGLYAGVKDVILRHGGSYKADYVYQLYMGRKLLI